MSTSTGDIVKKYHHTRNMLVAASCLRDQMIECSHVRDKTSLHTKSENNIGELLDALPIVDYGLFVEQSFEGKSNRFIFSLLENVGGQVIILGVKLIIP